MKTITYNPETHVLVARTASGVMQAAMEAQWQAGSYVDMAKRECGAAIAAAPQPELVDEYGACNGTGVVTTGSNGSGLIEAPCKNCEERAEQVEPVCEVNQYHLKPSYEWLEGEIGTWLESGAPESFKTVTVKEVMSLLIFFKGRII